MESFDIFNHRCPKCGCEKAQYIENEFNKWAFCMECGQKELLEKKKEYVPQKVNIPKCPTCGSINIEPVGFLETLGATVLLGRYSILADKTFHCKNCGYKW